MKLGGRLAVVFGCNVIAGCGSRTPLEVPAPDDTSLHANWLIKGKNLQAQRVAVDHVGAVYVLATEGDLSSSTNLDDRSLDGDVPFVFKRNVDGTEAWTRPLRSDDPSAHRGLLLKGFAVDPTTGASYVGGMNGEGASEAEFMRLDDNGVTAWRKAIGAEARADLVGVGPKGEGVFVGSFRSIDFGEGPLAADPRGWFAVAYDALGARLWSRQLPIPSSSDFWPEDIAVDADGRIYLAGEFGGTLHVGDQAVSAKNPYDRFLVALEADGTFRWVRHFDATQGSGLDRGTAVGVDGSGHVYLSSGFLVHVTVGDTTLRSPSRSIFVAQLDADGTPIRSTTLASEIAGPFVTALSIAKSGEVMLSANVGGPTDSSRRLFLSRLNPDLSLDWSWTASKDTPLDGRLFDSDGQLSSLDARSFAVAGAFTDTFSLDDVSVTDIAPTPGTRNIFIGEMFHDR